MLIQLVIIVGIIIILVNAFFYNFIQPVIEFFINISSQTPLLTDVVPEEILNGIKMLSLVLLAGFLVYGIITAFAGKTLGLQSELTPGKLFARIGLAILIIAFSHSSYTIPYSDLPLSENRNIKFCLVDILIGFSNKLVKTVSVRDGEDDTILAISVFDQQAEDYEEILGEDNPSFTKLVTSSTEVLVGLLVQQVVMFIASLFLLATIIRFLVFWIKRVALIVAFGSIIPIAGILLILPGTAHYSKLIFKKLILDIFIMFLVILTLSLGVYIIENEKLNVEYLNEPGKIWLKPIFRLVVLISFFMLALKIPQILDRAIGVDLGAFALTMLTTGYLIRSVSWAKGKYADHKAKKIGQGGSQTIGGIGRGGGSGSKGTGGAGSFSGKESAISSRQYSGSLKDAPQGLYNKWFSNWVDDAGYAPDIFQRRARSYAYARKDPVRMATFRDKYPEVKRKMDTADGYYSWSNKKKSREKFEKKVKGKV